MKKTYPHGRCKAKAKSTGRQCRNPIVSGREVCRIHGGLTPRGFDLPQTKHGRYSKDLPTRLAAKYLEAQSDADLLTLRAEIALVDTRTVELLAQVDTGESGRLWQLTSQTYDSLAEAIRAKDSAQMAYCLNELNHLIAAGGKQYMIWREITDNIEQRRKLVESERKHMVALQQTITADRAMLLIAAVVDIVRKNVSDPDTLRAIAFDVGGLVNQGAPVLISAGTE